MKTRIFAIVFTFAVGVLSSRAELVQFQATGTVTTSVNLPDLVNQPWTLTIIYDTAAPDQEPGDTTYGNFLNTASPVAMRQLDLVVGNYAIHLVNPVPVTPFNVRFDVDNFPNGGNPTKTFFAHVFEAALLPSWDGNQLSDFMLELLDNGNGNYADGTDALPTNTALQLADFTSSTLSIKVGGASFIGALTSLSFSQLSDTPSTAPTTPSPRPTITFSGKKKITTSKTKVTLTGKSAFASNVTVKVGTAAPKPASGTGSWRFTAALKPGVNKLSVVATGAGGISSPVKVTVVVRKR